jgi:hypothetical protein
MQRSTLIALAVLVVLIGVVYWLERDPGSGGDVATVFDVEPEAIDRVEIRRAGEEPVIIARVDNGDEFRVIAPVATAGDAREVDLILSNLATMAAVRAFELDEGAELGEFGLESARLEVRFTTDRGAEHGIRFGKDTLTASNQYAARIGSAEVLVVGAHLSANLDKSVWDLRDKAIFHVDDEAEPVRVSISHGDETLVLADDAGVWSSVSPPRTRVDRFDVIGMVSRFRNAEMLSFAEDDTATGLDPPQARLEVTFRDGFGPMTLEVGSKKTIDFYARVPGSPVFVIEGGLVSELQKDKSEWWSKKLLHHPTTEATQVRIVSDSGEVKTLDRGEAQDLLRALSAAAIDEVVTTTSTSKPRFVVTVTTDGLVDEISIRVADDAAYASRKAEDVALQLSGQTWTELEALLVDTIFSARGSK